MPGSIIVPDGIFVLCDEIIVRQQRTTELLKPLGGKFNDLVYNTGFTLVKLYSTTSGETEIQSSPVALDSAAVIARDHSGAAIGT